MTTRYLVFITLLLFVGVIFATNANNYKKSFRAKDAMEKVQGFEKLTQKNLDSRELSRSTGEYRPLRIFFDLTELYKELNSKALRMEERITMYKECFKIVGAWWADALNVNDEKGKIEAEVKKGMKTAGMKMHLDFKMNDKKMNDYDLLIRVLWVKSQPPSEILADASPILRHPASQRPLTGKVNVYSYGDTKWTGKSALTTASDTMIHEFGHIISFISFERMQKKNIKMDYVLKKMIWTGPIVLKRARTYYGCSTLAGVPLQTNNGKVGGHWDEEFLGVEMMTPTTNVGEHVGASV